MFKEQFSYDKRANSDANAYVQPTDPEEDRTVQSYKEDADINVIIKRFGAARAARPQPAGYYEVDSTLDYQSALNQVDDGRAKFSQVPAELRARFRNDPGKFLAFMADEKNHTEARKWGLLKPTTPEAPPIRVKVVPEPEKPNA